MIEKIDFELDSESNYSTIIVYHGTRIPDDVIMCNGLSYPGEEIILEWIKRAMDENCLSYDKWLENQINMTKKGKITTLYEIRKDYRKVIWTTDKKETAWSYALRAPELVSEAVRNEVVRLNSRKKNIFDIASESAQKAVDWFGEPKVIAINAKRIGACGGVNEPTLAHIPYDAIIGVYYGRT
jgi:hypothetical protein